MLIRHARTTLMAVAGTAGLAVLATPSAAHASAPTVTAEPADASAQSNPCDSWTDIDVFDPNGSRHFIVHVPTAGSQTKNANCILGQHSSGNGVFKLQTALILCNQQVQLTHDGKYGPQTAAAVKGVQAAAGFPADQQDGVYGPATFKVTGFPGYNPDGSFSGVCFVFPRGL